MRELVCIAPSGFWPIIRQGLSASNIKVRFVPRHDDAIKTREGAKHNDPYQVSAIVNRLRKKADGVLLVAPRSRSPRSVTPGPLVNHIPLGTVFANRPDDLLPWIDAVNFTAEHQLWAVLAMWQRSYMSIGRRFVKWMKGSNPHEVEGWYADNVSRDDLMQRMVQGPRVLIYVGHGRPRGLTGYRGIRWYHFTEQEERHPCGTFICFACSTLKRTHGVFPFGCRLVFNGITGAYFGAVEPLLVDANSRLAHHMGELFENNAAKDLGTLVKKLSLKLQDNPKHASVYKAFNDYRIIGNPLQQLL